MKMVSSAPQYSLRLSDWSTDAVDAKLFAFVPPADAKKIERIEADQIGDITLDGAMSRMQRLKKHLAAAAIVAALVATDDWLGANVIPAGALVTTAEARVGRPLTPGSVAGVARRTTRRTIRRSAIYVSTLPAGCIRTSVNGVAVSRCGGTYYQPYGGRYVVVYVD